MARDTQHGFTLIELMVVLVIVGIMSALISLSIKPAPAQLLRKDAQRLVQALQIAQAEVRADGRPIRWLADSKGYRFSRRHASGSGLEHFGEDPQLRPQKWASAPVNVRILPDQRLVFNAEWINAPVQILLSHGEQRLSIQRTALGQIEVSAP